MNERDLQAVVALVRIERMLIEVEVEEHMPTVYIGKEMVQDEFVLMVLDEAMALVDRTIVAAAVVVVGVAGRTFAAEDMDSQTLAVGDEVVVSRFEGILAAAVPDIE